MANDEWSLPISDGQPSVWVKQIPEGVEMTQEEYDATIAAQAFAERAEFAAEAVETQYQQINIWFAQIGDYDANIGELVAQVTADRVQTGLDRIATGLDRIQTGLDRVQTGQDRDAAAASALLAATFDPALYSTLTYTNAQIATRAPTVHTHTVSQLSDASANGRSWLQAASYAAMKALLALVKGDVGLGNVDNTADVDKPVSTAQATSIATKAALAHTHTVANLSDASANGRSWLQAASYAAMKTLLTLVKGDVGLGNVDNTSDANKPVSTAQAAADATRYGKDNAVGTVSQAAGVPTGAIVERGSNANGEYVRYADGTQICWFKSATTITNLSAAGSVFQLSAPTYTYPAAFAAIPTVIPNSTYSAGAGGWAALSSVVPTATACTVSLWSHAANNVSFPGYMAVGRWF